MQCVFTVVGCVETSVVCFSYEVWGSKFNFGYIDEKVTIGAEVFFQWVGAICLRKGRSDTLVPVTSGQLICLCRHMGLITMKMYISSMLVVLKLQSSE